MIGMKDVKRPHGANTSLAPLDISTIIITITIIVHPPGARRPTKVYSIDYNDYVYMDR